MFSLLLPCVLGAMPSVGFQTQEGWSARLLTQAPSQPPLLPSSSSMDDHELRAEIAALSKRIRDVNVHWPTGAVIAGYGGGILVYISVLSTLGALAAGGTSAIPAIVLVSLGVGGLGMLIAALIIGSAAANAALEVRETLMRERRELEEVLKSRGTPSPFVELRFPTAVLARF